MRTNATKVMSALLCLFLLLQLLLPGSVLAASQSAGNEVQASAGDKITWGPVNTVTYSPLHPYILLWSDPLSYGGLNLTTKQTTNSSTDADLVINVYGDIGANGIIEMNQGLQDPTDRNLPAYSSSLEVKQGGVYLISLHDGSLAKVRVDTLLPNKAMLSYVFEAAKTVTKLSASKNEISLKPGSTASVNVTATYSDNSHEDVTTKVTWSSDDPEVASVSNGIITGINEGDTTVKAELGGLTTSIQVNVSNDNAGEVERIEASEQEIVLKPKEPLPTKERKSR